MKDTFNQHFFSQNRSRLVAKMEGNSLAILGGNYPLYTNGDGVLPYIPNHDLWYFTGIEQDETILLIVKWGDSGQPSSSSKEYEEILFVLPRNPAIEVWDGERLSFEEARLQSGIEEILSINEWKKVVKRKLLWDGISKIYCNLQENPQALFYRNRNHDLLEYCQKRFPLHHYDRIAPLIHPLRMKKDIVEVDEIRRAMEVSHEALRRILPLLKLGYSEKDVEAEMTAVYTRHGAAAFSPIVASGKNSCTLHYIANHDPLRSGEVVLIDSGARAGMTGRYPTDITRVFPIRGKDNPRGEFTPRQRQVYEAVLRVLKQSTALVRPGVNIKEYQDKAVEFLREELLTLGLLKKSDLKDPRAHEKYFMHGVSHWLGLDVHDVGSYKGEFAEGMVLTCEPGIYIPEEKLGIRLENNLWIKSEKETENLSTAIPIEVEEVYQWLHQNSG